MLRKITTETSGVMLSVLERRKSDASGKIAEKEVWTR